MKMRQSVFAVVAAILLAFGLGACATTTGTSMHGSRAELYDSVRGIAADSTMVVVVEVKSQEVLKKDIQYTLSTATVLESFAPAGLGSEAPQGAPKVDGTEIVVRQMGAEGAELPYPILKPGEMYLLFLTPTMLEGAETQFYVTGGSAGMYAVQDGTFVHVPADEGDTLPETLTAKDLQG